MATPKKKPAAKTAPSKSQSKQKAAKPARNGAARAEPEAVAAAVPPPPAHDVQADERDADAVEATAGDVAAIASRRSKDTPAIFKLPKKQAPVVFTIDDVREVLKNRREEAREEAEKKEAAARKAARARQVVEEQQQQRVLGAATLADILGFNPVAISQPKAGAILEREVPAKFRKYHRLLVELRDSVKGGLSEHSRETLKSSPREEAGDLSDDGGASDGFDRDFALSLVANEQEALSEIAAAIQRIHDGTYGVCEITGKPIAAERLEAVPFTRYSLEGQAEFERQNRRRAQRSSAYLDSADDVAAFSSDDGDE